MAKKQKKHWREMSGGQRVGTLLTSAVVNFVGPILYFTKGRRP